MCGTIPNILVSTDVWWTGKLKTWAQDKEMGDRRDPVTLLGFSHCERIRHRKNKQINRQGFLFQHPLKKGGVLVQNSHPPVPDQRWGWGVPAVITNLEQKVQQSRPTWAESDSDQREQSGVPSVSMSGFYHSSHTPPASLWTLIHRWCHQYDSSGIPSKGCHCLAPPSGRLMDHKCCLCKHVISLMEAIVFESKDPADPDFQTRFTSFSLKTGRFHSGASITPATAINLGWLGVNLGAAFSLECGECGPAGRRRSLRRPPRRPTVTWRPLEPQRWPSLLQTPVIKACLLGQTSSSQPCSSLCLTLSCIINAALLFSFESALNHHVRAAAGFIFAAKGKQDDPQSCKQAARL